MGADWLEWEEWIPHQAAVGSCVTAPDRARLRSWCEDWSPGRFELPQYRNPRELKDDCLVLLDALDEAEKARDEAEVRLRREWWMNHGHSVPALYGDDGEMQCVACPCDFKREPLDDLYLHVIAAREVIAREALARIGGNDG